MSEPRDYHSIVFGICIALIILTVIIVATVQGQAVQIDMEAIQEIESGGNPEVVGKAGEVGLYQIMPVVRKSYNERTGHGYSRGDLFDPGINFKIASWYMNERIPQMLRYYGIPVTVRSVIWAYNAGIGRVVDGIMPSITESYLRKYRRLSDE